MKESRTRNTGLDGLRILCMFLIVLSHFSVHTIWPDGTTAGGTFVVNLTGMLGKTAVDCFVLISAYFMADRPLNIQRVVKLLVKTLLCAILIPIILKLCHVSIVEYEGMRQYLPFMNQSYWFMDTYFLLMLVSPLLNMALVNITQKQLKTMIIAMLVPASILPLLMLQNTFTSYLFWFVILYLIGAYLKKFDISCTRRKAGIVSLLMMVVLLGSIYAIHAIELSTGSQVASGSFYLTDYWQLPVLVCAVSMFLYFRQCQFKESILLQFLSSQAIGVYLISDHAALRYTLWREWINAAQFYYSRLFGLYAVVICAAVFLVCELISWTGNLLLERPIMKGLNQLGAKFHH